MKIKGWGIGFGIMAGLICKGLAQVPPSNDNYTNRTVLSGTDVTFSGTLAGATIETSQEMAAYNSLFGTVPSQSVWWSWTAPVSTDLTVEMVGTSLPGGYYPSKPALVIYNQTNESDLPNGLTNLAAKALDLSFTPLSVSIPVVAGSNYLFQLIGTNSASYTFRLLATNSPVIVQQPRSQTVSSNASILFYVVYAGTTQTNFGFQWYFNGNGIVGETAPMLALTNVDSTQAGAYTVAVSNAAGVTMSQPATLTVSTTNTPITLGATPATRGYFGFSLTGESGRNYRIQASTDEAIWANANYFPLDSFYSSGTSVVWNSNATTRLTVTNDAPQKFFRALPYLLTNANSAICVDNLREIRVAKMLFQRDYNAYPSANLSASQLLPYFPHQVLPSCPLDRSATFYTSYNINNITTEPTCEISTNHICEDPR